jgi:transcriptional regulator with XRE-family HTH domain
MLQGSLGRKLRVLRAERGLRQDQAAELIGVAPETLSDLERGKRRAYAPTLSKIAKGYGVPVEELVAEEPPLAEASRAGRAEKVRLGDVLSDARLAEVEDEHARLNTALQAGEITPAFYTRRMADLYASMAADAQSAAREADPRKRSSEVRKDAG